MDLLLNNLIYSMAPAILLVIKRQEYPSVGLNSSELTALHQSEESALPGINFYPVTGLETES